jgi:hypothetical protein
LFSEKTWTCGAIAPHTFKRELDEMRKPDIVCEAFADQPGDLRLMLKNIRSCDHSAGRCVRGT